MGIASMVCGIVGILGGIITGTRLIYLQTQNTFIQFLYQREQFYLAIFAVFSFILLLLAFIFGIISLKKGKGYKYRGVGITGFVLGIVGFAPFIILIISVIITVITYNIMNKDSQNNTLILDQTSPCVGKRPEYSFYTGIGSITTTTKTKNETNYSITVDMIIGYDLNDQSALLEFTSRRHELGDFIKEYFSGKNAIELQPENEVKLKQEIREILNTRFLDTARVRIILFNKLEITKM
jgi:flagellar FliL protein